MEVEGTQGGEEVSRDPSVDLLLGQYALKFRDTVEDLPGNLEVLTTSIAKATDWVLRAAHHNLLTIDDAFVAQMTSFVNAVMVTDFSRIRGPGELDNFSLTSLLEAEMCEKALRTSVHAEVFAYLSTKPRIDRNSAHSTLCTVYCNIWDSQQGTRAKKALGQPIFLTGRSCAIRPAARHTGVLLCQCCWKWDHPTIACKAKQLSCPICLVKPPVLPTPRNQPCPHKGHCVNCYKDHTANSASCKFWAHRYICEWIMAKYRQVHEHAARHQLTNPQT
ncbi:unnamed protein product [Cyclocybe aegerita]|uniref:Uncharacterized protein n=1 Tax=Cyclocybe aegerita TaxID=1973307 RepID=A0A8S0XP12_CYCAE|nr:unnamed protein product [Cyclocybe aegerita]